MKPFPKTPLYSWGISVGLHLALFGWLNITEPLEPIRVEMDAGEATAALILMDLPETQILEDSQTLPTLVNNPPLPFPVPVAIPPVSPQFPVAEQLPQIAVTSEVSSMPDASVVSAPPKSPTGKSSGEHRGQSRPANTSGERDGSSRRSGSEGIPGALRNPPPEYPRQERLAGHEGTVVLSVRVEPDGIPSRVVIITSSGFALLDASALNTVSRRWRFRARQAKVASEFLLPIRFALKDRRLSSL